VIEWTPKQRLLLDSFSSEIDHYFLPGGARAGKTFQIVCCQLITGQKYPKSRHIVTRLHYNHAKISLWMDTIPKAIELLGMKSLVKLNKTDTMLQFDNGSEYWIDGLDDADRVEKILGREYCSIFFNEVSQISYDAVGLVRTRLAQNIPGCHNRAFYDCNPVGRGHWAYKEMVQGIEPTTGIALDPKRFSRYFHMNMSPYDNAANLPEGYIENNLESLPEAKRKRFLLGEWNDPEGVIFTNWDLVETVPDEVKKRARRTIGVDFGFSVDPAVAIDVYTLGDEIWVDELIYETGLMNNQIAGRLKAENVGHCDIYCDSAEPKSIQELRSHGLNAKPAIKGPDSIRAGIDSLLGKKIHITRRSTNCINDAENYAWKKNKNDKILPEPIADFDHFWDALRYSSWFGSRGQVSTGSLDLRGRMGI
jgi:PBSX family phage terminase large subunit